MRTQTAYRLAASPRQLALSALLALIALLSLCPAPACAGPVRPAAVPLTQPDGTTFEALPFGDEWQSGYETADGYTILLDAVSGYWHYAQLDAADQLAPTARRVGRDAPTDLTPHLRPAPAANPNRFPIAVETAPDGAAFAGNMGTQRVLGILVSFNDRAPVGSTAAQWASRLFGAGDSVKDYYEDVSYDQLHLAPAGDSSGAANDGIVGWLNIGYNHPDTRAGTLTSNAVRQLARDAIVAANPYVNFASFDTNGDGSISINELHIIVVAAGYETSFGGAAAACTPNLWAHRWSLGFSYNGGYVDAPTVDGKVVGDWAGGGGYSMFGEWHCANFANPGHMAHIGIMAHELGHDLTWPDLYDIDGSSNGVGYYSIMGSGSWLDKVVGNESGNSPAHPDPFLKWYQGWLTPSRLAGAQSNVSLAQVETNPRVVQLLNNPAGVDWSFEKKSGTGEYFLVENRQKVGYDVGLPGCGLLIWHIDETRTYTNTANAGDARRLVDLEEADGLRHLDIKTNRGDAGDFYPGGTNNRTFNAGSNPNSLLYGGAASGVSVTNISACAATMTANTQAPGSSLNRKAFLPLVMKRRGGPPPVGTATRTPTRTPTSLTRTLTPTRTRTPTPTTTPPAGGWTNIVTENFEGAFPGVWRVHNNTGSAPGVGYIWGKRTCRPFAGGSSGWAVGGGTQGAGLSCGSNYPDDNQSWMVYGPFSLAGATDAELRLKLWTYSESGYDEVALMASVNGENFYGDTYSGDSEGWRDEELDLTDVYTLGNLLGRSQVWIAIIFATDSSATFAEGAYVDNIVLRKCTSGSCPAQAGQPAAPPAGWSARPGSMSLIAD